MKTHIGLAGADTGIAIKTAHMARGTATDILTADVITKKRTRATTVSIPNPIGDFESTNTAFLNPMEVSVAVDEKVATSLAASSK